MQAAVNKLKQDWDLYVSMIEEFNQRQSEFINNTSSHIFSFTAQTAPVHEALSIVEELAELAVKSFSPASAKIEIDIQDLVSEINFPDSGDLPNWKRIWKENPCQLKDFDPVAVWNHLERKYNNSSSKNDAIAGIARTIAHSFATHSQLPAMKAGKVCFSMTVWLDDIAKEFRKQNKLSFESKRNIVGVLTAMHSFFIHDEDVHNAALCMGAINKWQNDYAFSSRESTELDGSGSRLVCYLSKFEFQLSRDTASRLQVFMEFYAPGSTKIAA